ncbi:Uncharacterized secreted [Sparassis crispa]|uniref:Uncharacterized secreted n=1 Tax=Sparassis crispa TaxID=139825 RepID=A0A401G676_9APHY|nr:Uncharacterized secreted [Sparassis crispa]GBE77665.1 Uncharacterized secreted [Sparassis crispa]
MLVSVRCLAQLIFPLLSLSVGTHASSVRRQATTCNGHAELCGRSFGNVTFVGAHDSYAVSASSLAANQDYNATQQLDDGIRMLQMQAHNSSGTIELCHTSCLLFDGGTLKSYLTSVKTWMDSNPDNVVSLLIVNSDNIPPSDYDTVFQSVGLASMAYAPPSASLPASGWPTLETLINSGKPLVVFLTTEADYQTVPYLIDEFTNIWETAYDVTTTTFDCNVNRTNGDSSTQMYLINHFLDEESIAAIPVPNKAAANVTNGVSGVGSLGQQVQTCASEYGRNPNFMLVDFYEYGNGSVFQVAATANSVTYTPSSPVATPITSSSSSSSSSGAVGGVVVTWGHLGGSFTILLSVLFGVWSIV